MKRTEYRSCGRWVAGLVGFLVLAVAGPTFAQPASVLDRLADAFTRGDADALFVQASDRVEISLQGDSKVYSRAQATYVMQNFFKAYPPERFTLERDSRSEGSWFAACTYRHKGDTAPLLVYLRLRRKNRAWELREVRIEQPPGG